MKHSKKCKQCGVVFHKRPKDSMSQWENRKYCSVKCRGEQKSSLKKPEFKFCEQCGFLFEKGEGNTKHWKTRKFCSNKCKNESMVSHDGNSFKFCKQCGFIFYRKKSYTNGGWKKVLFCSHSCGLKNRYRHKVSLIKCVVCGADIPRRDSDSNSVYLKRKTCSAQCLSIIMSKNKNTYEPGSKHTNWKGGLRENSSGYLDSLCRDGKPSTIHVAMVENYLGRELEKCECVHHCNRNIKDNRLDNLELMTRSEHARLHGSETFARVDVKKKSRKARRLSQVKETHGCWKDSVTPFLIDLALKTNTTKKEAAKTLGIHPDTLRARIKYYTNKGMTF